MSQMSSDAGTEDVPAKPNGPGPSWPDDLGARGSSNQQDVQQRGAHHGVARGSILFDDSNEEGPLDVLIAIRQLRGDIRRLDKRIDNLGASTAYNVEVMQHQRAELQKPSTSQTQHDAEVAALRRSNSTRFEALDRMVENVMRVNVLLGDRLTRAEKALAAYGASAEAAEPAYMPRARPNALIEDRPRRMLREDDAQVAPRQAYARPEPRARLAAYEMDEDPAPWPGRAAEPEPRFSRLRSITPPPPRPIRARSRSPEPYRRSMAIADSPPPARRPPMSEEWSARLADPTSYYPLADILRELSKHDREIEITVIVNALRARLGDRGVDEISAACDNPQRYLNLAAKHLRFTQPEFDQDVIIFSDSQRPFYKHEINQDYFRLLSAKNPLFQPRRRSSPPPLPPTGPRSNARYPPRPPPQAQPPAESYQPRPQVHPSRQIQNQVRSNGNSGGNGGNGDELAAGWGSPPPEQPQRRPEPASLNSPPYRARPQTPPPRAHDNDSAVDELAAGWG